jgi:hypothetical protein
MVRREVRGGVGDVHSVDVFGVEQALGCAVGERYAFECVAIGGKHDVNWGLSEPDDADCGVLDNNNWRDRSCTSDANWICEVPWS